MVFNPSHPGEVLKDYLGDMTVQEAARRLGVTRAKPLPDTQRPRRHFSDDERAACQGDAIHVSRVLAEAAGSITIFRRLRKAGSQNQTVFGTAAKGACLGLTSHLRRAQAALRLCSLVAQTSNYKRQIPVIEQAIETAAPMLGTDKSRGTVWR